MVYVKLIIFFFKVYLYRYYHLASIFIRRIFKIKNESENNDDWLNQLTGEINHFDPKIHKGDQPIRVLRNILLHMFVNYSGDVKYELLVLMWKGRLNGKMDFQIGNEPIFNPSRRPLTPYVDKKRTLQLHETFLSYVWCICYSNYTLLNQWISFPNVNCTVGYLKYKIDPEIISKALDLFQYSVSLVRVFSVWDKDQLPNPEKYLAENRDYVEQSNILYVEALKFILFHENTHIKEHIHYIDLGIKLETHHFVAIEWEADNKALDLTMAGVENDSHKMLAEFGIILGVLSMFYLSPNTRATHHPNKEDRLTNVLEKLNLDKDSDNWALACLGLEMWNRQFGFNYSWTNVNTNYKDLYYSIVSDIKTRP